MEPKPTELRLRAMQLAVIHQRMIEAYAFAITRDFHLAEDIHQEVALVLVTHWETVPADSGFMPWLKEVIRRKALELRRRETRMPRLLSPEALAQVEACLPLPVEDELPEVMARCVEKLGSDARQAVLSRYGEGLDVAQIAARLGRSVQGVYAVLKRARIALEECVARTRRPSLGQRMDEHMELP